MPSDWAGKTVLVTGASRGIGKACATLFAQQGANLVLASRSKADLETTATSIAKKGQRVLVVPTDVTESSQVNHPIREAVVLPTLLGSSQLNRDKQSTFLS
jgi:short-subunit dehydrogenase